MLHFIIQVRKWCFPRNSRQCSELSSQTSSVRCERSKARAFWFAFDVMCMWVVLVNKWFLLLLFERCCYATYNSAGSRHVGTAPVHEPASAVFKLGDTAHCDVRPRMVSVRLCWRFLSFEVFFLQCFTLFRRNHNGCAAIHACTLSSVQRHRRVKWQKSALLLATVAL